MENTQKEYEVFFAKRMEEKEQAYQSAFNAYLEFAKLREVEEEDEKKVALENEVVALHNEVKYLQEQMDFAFQKIQKDAEKNAKKHLIEILTSLAKEEYVEYVLNSPFLVVSQINIDFTSKAIEKASLEESGTQALLRGGNN
jgi:DNA-binding GntR family transcriptional regulator